MEQQYTYKELEQLNEKIYSFFEKLFNELEIKNDDKENFFLKSLSIINNGEKIENDKDFIKKSQKTLNTLNLRENISYYKELDKAVKSKKFDKKTYDRNMFFDSLISKNPEKKSLQKNDKVILIKEELSSKLDNFKTEFITFFDLHKDTQTNINLEGFLDHFIHNELELEKTEKGNFNNFDNNKIEKKLEFFSKITTTKNFNENANTLFILEKNFKPDNYQYQREIPILLKNQNFELIKKLVFQDNFKEILLNKKNEPSHKKELMTHYIYQEIILKKESYPDKASYFIETSNHGKISTIEGEKEIRKAFIESLDKSIKISEINKNTNNLSKEKSIALEEFLNIKNEFDNSKLFEKEIDISSFLSKKNIETSDLENIKKIIAELKEQNPNEDTIKKLDDILLNINNNFLSLQGNPDNNIFRSNLSQNIRDIETLHKEINSSKKSSNKRVEETKKQLNEDNSMTEDEKKRKLANSDLLYEYYMENIYIDKEANEEYSVFKNILKERKNISKLTNNGSEIIEPLLEDYFKEGSDKEAIKKNIYNQIITNNTLHKEEAKKFMESFNDLPITKSKIINEYKNIFNKGNPFIKESIQKENDEKKLKNGADKYLSKIFSKIDGNTVINTISKNPNMKNDNVRYEHKATMVLEEQFSKEGSRFQNSNFIYTSINKFFELKNDKSKNNDLETIKRNIVNQIVINKYMQKEEAEDFVSNFDNENMNAKTANKNFDSHIGKDVHEYLKNNILDKSKNTNDKSKFLKKNFKIEKDLHFLSNEMWHYKDYISSFGNKDKVEKIDPTKLKSLKEGFFNPHGLKNSFESRSGKKINEIQTFPYEKEIQAKTNLNTIKENFKNEEDRDYYNQQSTTNKDKILDSIAQTLGKANMTSHVNLPKDNDDDMINFIINNTDDGGWARQNIGAGEFLFKTFTVGKHLFDFSKSSLIFTKNFAKYTLGTNEASWTEIKSIANESKETMKHLGSIYSEYNQDTTQKHKNTINAVKTTQNKMNKLYVNMSDNQKKEFLLNSLNKIKDHPLNGIQKIETNSLSLKNQKARGEKHAAFSEFQKTTLRNSVEFIKTQKNTNGEGYSHKENEENVLFESIFKYCGVFNQINNYSNGNREKQKNSLSNLSILNQSKLQDIGITASQLQEFGEDYLTNINTNKVKNEKTNSDEIDKQEKMALANINNKGIKDSYELIDIVINNSNKTPDFKKFNQILSKNNSDLTLYSLKNIVGVYETIGKQKVSLENNDLFLDKSDPFIHKYMFINEKEYQDKNSLLNLGKDFNITDFLELYLEDATKQNNNSTELEETNKNILKLLTKVPYFKKSLFIIANKLNTKDKTQEDDKKLKIIGNLFEDSLIENAKLNNEDISNINYYQYGGITSEALVSHNKFKTLHKDNIVKKLLTNYNSIPEDKEKAKDYILGYIKEEEENNDKQKNNEGKEKDCDIYLTLFYKIKEEENTKTKKLKNNNDLETKLNIHLDPHDKNIKFLKGNSVNIFNYVKNNQSKELKKLFEEAINNKEFIINEDFNFEDTFLELKNFYNSNLKTTEKDLDKISGTIPYNLMAHYSGINNLEKTPYYNSMITNKTKDLAIKYPHKHNILNNANPLFEKTRDTKIIEARKIFEDFNQIKANIISFSDSTNTPIEYFHTLEYNFAINTFLENESKAAYIENSFKSLSFNKILASYDSLNKNKETILDNIKGLEKIAIKQNEQNEIAFIQKMKNDFRSNIEYNINNLSNKMNSVFIKDFLENMTDQDILKIKKLNEKLNPSENMFIEELYEIILSHHEKNQSIISINDDKKAEIIKKLIPLSKNLPQTIEKKEKDNILKRFENDVDKKDKENILNLLDMYHDKIEMSKNISKETILVEILSIIKKTFKKNNKELSEIEISNIKEKIKEESFYFNLKDSENEEYLLNKGDIKTKIIFETDTLEEMINEYTNKSGSFISNNKNNKNNEKKDKDEKDKDENKTFSEEVFDDKFSLLDVGGSLVSMAFSKAKNFFKENIVGSIDNENFNPAPSDLKINNLISYIEKLLEELQNINTNMTEFEKKDLEFFKNTFVSKFYKLKERFKETQKTNNDIINEEEKEDKEDKNEDNQKSKQTEEKTEKKSNLIRKKIN
jgi:hypothetical protein